MTIEKHHRKWQTHSNWHQHWVCQRELLTPALEQLLHDPNQAFATAPIRTLKTDYVSDLIVITCDQDKFVIKRHNLTGLGRRLRRALSPSRAWRNWHNAHRLQAWGIQTPEPIAYIEKRFGPLRLTAFYIARYVDGDWLCRLLPTLSPTLQQSIATHIVDMLLTIHRHGFIHGDMKSTNFLLDNDNHVYLLDLDVMRRPWWNKRKKQLKDCRRLLRNWQQHPDLLEKFTHAFTTAKTRQ